MQGHVLGLGFLQNGDVGVGVLPQSEKIAIGRSGLVFLTRERVSASQLQVS